MTFISCVTCGKLFALSEPQFPHLCNGVNDPYVTVRWGSGYAHALRAGKVPRESVVTTEGLDAVPSLAEPPRLRDPLTSGGSGGDQEARKCDRVARGNREGGQVQTIRRGGCLWVQGEAGAGSPPLDSGVFGDRTACGRLDCVPAKRSV